MLRVASSTDLLLLLCRCWFTTAYHGRDFKGQTLTVQFARGNRHHTRHEYTGGADRSFPRPRRTAFRMNITGLQPDTSWQVGALLIPTAAT